MKQEDGKTGRFLDGSSAVIAACIDIHSQLGPGLLESVYERCLCYEFVERGIVFERQRPVPVIYKGVALDCGYRIDFVVNQRPVVELKAVERIERVHIAQVLTYLKLTGLEAALLINFNVPTLKEGIRRLERKPNPNPLPVFSSSC